MSLSSIVRLARLPFVFTASTLLGTSLLAVPSLLSAQTSASSIAPPIAPFSRHAGAPIITPDPAAVFTDPILHRSVHWEALHTFNPAAIIRDGRIVVLFRAEDNTGSMKIGGHTSRLGMATSSDGLHFKRLPEPIFYPAEDQQKSREWPGGVEDPRLIESPLKTPAQRYVLTYTQYNQQTYSIGIATSADLVHWQKHGPAFLGASGGVYDQLQYKSGGIVTELVHGRLVAAKINGKFWMYWGEVVVHLATSSDLVHWTPLEDPATHHPVEVLTRRSGHFDSGFPEVGPPPILTPGGIVVIYNGKNDPDHGDSGLGANAYAAGEALFSADDPAHLLGRTDGPVLKPEQPWEKTGQYAAGTTFAEGLVPFHGKWLLFYGCADSAVGLAEAPRP